MASLPIDPLLPELHQALTQHNRCILQAAPGAGKTTRVPPALLDQPWLGQQKILMLEPRRIATRSAARFMATELGEKPGQTIGYRTRMDTKVSNQTRIEVVTEGILTRMIQADPALEGIGCVIFDEFHERNLQADLGLALLLQSQELLRDDLRLLVMSATLDSDQLLNLLGNQTPLLSSSGRSFAVQTHYCGGSPLPFDAERLADVIEQAAADDDASLLCFLPGSGEIRRTLRALGQRKLPDNLQLLPLYGNLSAAEQDRAISPCHKGQRKLVLATAIAETSLTIEGIATVIDAGLMRLPRFDPRSGMTRLQTLSVSAASAEQRRGRAGRLQEGNCYRLWAGEQRLRDQSPAEILNADLAPLVLELAQWGADPDELSWIDPPPAPHLLQAQQLLRSLGALDPQHQMTALGQQMLAFGTHPRLAAMMLQAKPLGLAPLACHLAALLNERDPLRSDSADLHERLLYLRHQRQQPAVKRILESAKRWCRQLQVSHQLDEDSFDQAGLLLAYAFPDRIGQRRNLDQPQGRQFRLSNGKGAELSGQDRLNRCDYLVCAELDGDKRSARIYLAAPLQYDQLVERFEQRLEQRQQVGWNSQTRSVQGYQQLWLGELCLQQQPIQQLSEQQCIDGLLQGIREQGLKVLPWSEASRSLQQRLCLLNRLQPEMDWPDISDDSLLKDLGQWLAPYLSGMKKLTQLQQLDLYQVLVDQLDWNQQQQLDQLLPLRIQLPSGSQAKIDYSDPQQPILAARLQELFGWQQSPSLVNGALKLTLHLLSPAQRPIQVTQDLASFWTNTYPEVCKDLKGRYPKHFWPEDPLTARATRQTKKQMDRQKSASRNKGNGG